MTLTISSIVVIALISFASAFEVPDTFTNENVVRSIDLSSPTTHERLAISIKSTKKAQDYYISVLQQQKKTKIALVQVQEKVDKSFVDLNVESVGCLDFIPLVKKCLFKVVPHKPETVLTVDIFYSHAMRPVPSEIKQKDPQMLQFDGDLYFFSPYNTVSQKTKIRLSSSVVNSFTKPAEKTGKTINYGPYNDISRYSLEPLEINAEFQLPYVYISRLSKQLTVSHWAASLSFNEDYMMISEGPQLKNQFSRIEYILQSLTRPNNHVLKQISFELPVHAYNVYYRDEVGNVSTSNLRYQKDSALLAIKPRYPLFGDWKYSWSHGYSVPLKDFVVSVPGTDLFVFRVKFYQGLQGSPTDSFSMKIVLPEGAELVKTTIGTSSTTSTDVTATGNSTKLWTYLDTVGKNVLFFERENMVDAEGEYLYIVYKYPFSNYLRKIFVSSTGILSLFLLAIVYVRTETSLRK